MQARRRAPPDGCVCVISRQMATLTLARAGAATARAGRKAVADRGADRAERPDPGAEARDRRLARARGGDLDAFAELVRHHQRLVFGIACRMLGDRGAAE